MKVFVTGATGAVGPHAATALLDAGHEVTGLARSQAKAEQLAELGVRPVEVSLFDPSALAGALAGHDAVVNLATSIPPTWAYALPWMWRANDRLRTHGSASVVEAALRAGVGRLVQESVALAYPDNGAAWIDEDLPVDLFSITRSSAVAEANVNRFSDAGGTGVVLRFGAFYGPGSAQSSEMLAMARWRFVLALGRPSKYFSVVHLADAGRAVAAALSAPAGVYNIVDDEPLTEREYGDALAAAANRRPLLRGPGRAAALFGPNMAAVVRSHRTSNARFKAATGWAPRFPDARLGWADTAAARLRR